MRKKYLFSIIVLITLFCVPFYSFSQCYYTGSYTDCCEGQINIPDCKIHNVSVLNPYPPHDPITIAAGTYCGVTEGHTNEFYSLDITNPVIFGAHLQDSGFVTDIHILYILYHYEEYTHTPPGRLADTDEECAATQMAIWHYSDGLDLNTMDTSSPGSSAKKRIHSRAWYIVNDAEANAGAYTVIAPIQFIPGANPNDFSVKVVNQEGNPQSGKTVQFCLSDVSSTLSQYSAITNGSGVTPTITYTGPGTGNVGAKAVDILLPTGRIFVSGTTGSSRRIVTTGKTSDAYVGGDYCDQINFFVLPVELASFTGTVSGRDITLNWNTLNELNNSSFEVHKSSVGSDRWLKIGSVQGHGTSNQPHEYSYVDRNLSSGRFTYRLKQIDFNGNYKWYSLGTEIGVGVPSNFNLSQNYPNPFNPSTIINYDLPKDGFATLKVFDVSGKEIKTLVNNNIPAGYHSVTFDAGNLPSGIYYYKLESNGLSKVMKMAFVK